MYVKIDRGLKTVKRIETKSDLTTILFHTKTEAGLEEEYKFYPDFSNDYLVRILLSADIYILNDTLCGNEEHKIQMTLIFLRTDNQFQKLVGLALTVTMNFIVTTQPFTNKQMIIFSCSRGSFH